MNRYKRAGPNEAAAPNNQTQKEQKCEKCDKNFKSVLELRTHMSEKHTPRKTGPGKKCDKCDFIYRNEYQLNKHKQIAHTRKEEVCWFWMNTNCHKQEA